MKSRPGCTEKGQGEVSGALEALASEAETTSDKTLRQSARDAIDSIENDTVG